MTITTVHIMSYAPATCVPTTHLFNQLLATYMFAPFVIFTHSTDSSYQHTRCCLSIGQVSSVHHVCIIVSSSKITIQYILQL